MTLYQPSQQTREQIDRTFIYHAPHGDQAQRYEQLRNFGHNFANMIVNFTPPSREQSVALTKLQEVVMFANAAIAINERVPQQPTEPPAKQETA